MILRKSSLKYKLLEIAAFVGDAGLEFLVNDFAKGGRIYPRHKRYNVHYFETLLRELATTGYIERVVKDGISHIRLTSAASTKIARHIPLPYLQKKKWDGYFRGLSYDFPEKIGHKRDNLREQIRTWGMGKFHLSLWITPHPLEQAIDDFIVSQHLTPYAARFMSKKLSITEGREIAENVWKLEELENKYLEFIDKWDDKLLNKKIKYADLPIMRFEYFSIIKKDPHLPFNLLYTDWPSEQAKSTYLAIQENLVKK